MPKDEAIDIKESAEVLKECFLIADELGNKDGSVTKKELLGFISAVEAAQAQKGGKGGINPETTKFMRNLIEEGLPSVGKIHIDKGVVAIRVMANHYDYNGDGKFAEQEYAKTLQRAQNDPAFLKKLKDAEKGLRDACSFSLNMNEWLPQQPKDLKSDKKAKEKD